MWRPFAVLAGIVLTVAVIFSASHSSRAADGPSDYVDSRLCANCHASIYETYGRTGMARSFYRPRPENTVEDYKANNSYYHAASDTHFTMIERDGKYYQRRYQIGFQGKETNVDEKEIDCVMGSGNHVRSYLHRTSAGGLQELPLAWYSEKGGYWAMNPGYDKPDQLASGLAGMGSCAGKIGAAREGRGNLPACRPAISRGRPILAGAGGGLCGSGKESGGNGGFAKGSAIGLGGA